MKKILIVLSILLCAPAYANTITVESISPDSNYTVYHSNFQTVGTLVNGNIEGSCDGGTTNCNLDTDTVYEINMADDANPRVRDSEIFNITVDTISGGSVSSQGTFVESGCVQATDSDLTADISACVAYINGYRVSKSSTSQTYANNTTTYLWLSQAGVYTQSTNPNTTVANSALLASVVTSGGAITTVNSLFTTRVPTLVIPSNYRDGFLISRDSATTLTVSPGSAEINNTMLSKTTVTTLTLGTAADWSGGASLAAANTFGFVGINAAGEIDMHTTAPSHQNYAVSVTAGKKRYATWASSTVYRILGWFYMGTSTNIDVASNIKDGSIPNKVFSNDTALLTSSSTSFVDANVVRFYNSGGDVLLMNTLSGDGSASSSYATLFQDGTTDLSGSGTAFDIHTTTQSGASTFFMQSDVSQATRSYKSRVKTDGSTLNLRRRGLTVIEQ